MRWQRRGRSRGLRGVHLLVLLGMGCGGATYTYEASPSEAKEAQRSAAETAGDGAEARSTATPRSYEWDPPSLAGDAAASDEPAAEPPSRERAEAEARKREHVKAAAPAEADSVDAEPQYAAAPADSSGAGLLEGAVAQAQQPQGGQGPPQGGGSGNGNGPTQNGGEPSEPPETPETPEPDTAPEAPEEPGEQESDGEDTEGPLLIYTADLHMAVFQVEQTQEKIIEAAEDVDGHLQKRSDRRVVIRVPADKFRETVDEIEKLGDILARNIQASDVSEQFRDISIRLDNAKAMRKRLEKLLDEAESVEEALEIEKEMQRLTETIETLKGRLRFLRDRISFSTITVRFKSRSTEKSHPDTFRLPFEWLDGLGLSNLLRLR